MISRRSFRLDLQLLLTVDAAILAVGAELEDLVALFLDGGDATGVLAPHDVDPTLGGLGLFLLDGPAIFDDGHADVGVEIGQHGCGRSGGGPHWRCGCP